MCLIFRQPVFKSMARPKKDTTSPDMRHQILQAARIEFAHSGFGVPLQAIAARCGIQRPSLLHHFRSKEALLQAVLEDILHSTETQLLDLHTRYGQAKEAAAQQLLQHKVLELLREVEAREKGVAGVLLQALLLPLEGQEITSRIGKFIGFLTQIIGQPDSRAELAQLLAGELVRLAMADRAHILWGRNDGLESLYSSFLNTTEARAFEK